MSQRRRLNTRTFPGLCSRQLLEKTLVDGVVRCSGELVQLQPIWVCHYCHVTIIDQSTCELTEIRPWSSCSGNNRQVRGVHSVETNQKLSSANRSTFGLFDTTTWQLWIFCKTTYDFSFNLKSFQTSGYDNFLNEHTQMSRHHIRSLNVTNCYYLISLRITRNHSLLYSSTLREFYLTPWFKKILRSGRDVKFWCKNLLLGTLESRNTHHPKARRH